MKKNEKYEEDSSDFLASYRTGERGYTLLQITEESIRKVRQCLRAGQNVKRGVRVGV